MRTTIKLNAQMTRQEERQGFKRKANVKVIKNSLKNYKQHAYIHMINTF